MDEVILDAAFASVSTGKTGSSSVSFPNTQQVAVDYVESGSATNSGLTIGKLRRAKQILDANEVDPTERRYIAVTAKQINDLLRTTEVTSADFNTVRALVQGELNSFMGFEFVRTELVRTNASSQRRCVAWAQSGLLLAVGSDITVDIGPRRDKRNSTQVYVSASFGATRMEEEKVVELICAE